MSLAQTIEALLFVSDEPATVASLAEAAEASEADVLLGLREVAERLQGTCLEIVQLAGGYQMCTREEYAEAIARYLKPQRQRLSRSLMEVLAIIAYKQPVTMAEIDAVRGVQSDYGLRGLLERRLVVEVGRRDAPGRPVLYGTTDSFLHQFNLNELGQLPPLSENDGLPLALHAPATEMEPDGASLE